MKASRRWMLGTMMAAAASLAWADAPDLNGVWQVIDPPSAIHTSTGALPPLLDDARSTYESNIKARAAGNLSFDGTERCLPPGIPRLMYVPEPFEIIQRSGYLYMLFEYQHLNREILVSDHHNPLIYGRRFLGDSTAQVDGNSLVVDSTGFKTGTLLDSAGLPHSKDLHVIEHFTLDKGGKELVDRITIEDAKSYSQPWETSVRFKRLRNVTFKEDVCVDRHPDWIKNLQKSDQ